MTSRRPASRGAGAALRAGLAGLPRRRHPLRHVPLRAPRRSRRPPPPAAAGRHRGEVGGGCAKGPESMGRPHSCVAAVVCCRQRQTTALQAVRLRAALRARPSLPYIVFLCRRRSCSQRSRKGKCSAMAGGLFRCHHRLVIFSSFLHNSKLQL